MEARTKNLAAMFKTAFIVVITGNRSCQTLNRSRERKGPFSRPANQSNQILKIDGAFVKDILDDPLNLALVKSINEIGHVMGKQTIAEFVENEAILVKLREIGVDYAQGYGIARPRPIEDEEILTEPGFQLDG